MSIRFFRKHEKLIPTIMIVLMVAFIVGFQGLSMLFRRGQENPTLGTMQNGTKITQNDLATAQRELRILTLVYSEIKMLPNLNSLATVIGSVSRSRYSVSVESFALAKAQASAQGIKVLGFEPDSLCISRIEEALNSDKTKGNQYSRFLADMRQAGYSLGDIKGAFAAGLKVNRWIELNSIPGCPDKSAARAIFKAKNEKIAARVLEIDREKFIPKTKPTEKEIIALFDEYKTVAKNSNTDANKFNFGYKLPNRISAAVGILDTQILANSIVPSRAQIKAFKNANPTLVASYAKLTRTERNDKITQEIKRIKTEELTNRLSTALSAITEKANEQTADLKKKDPKSTKVVNPFSKLSAYIKSQKVSATPILNRKIMALSIDKLPIEDAVNQIVSAAGGSKFVINFPTGKIGDATISPDIKISITENNITVGKALELVAAQIKDIPKLKWTMLKGLDSALFVECPEFNNFPVYAYNFTEQTADQIQEALSTRMNSYISTHLAKALATEMKEKRVFNIPSPIALSSMQIAFIPASAPKEITPAIKKQIIEDWKFMKSYEAALADAKTLKSADDLQKRIDSLVKAELAKQEKEYDADHKVQEPKKGTPAPKAEVTKTEAKPVTPKVDKQTPAQKKANWRKETSAEIRESIVTNYPLNDIQNLAKRLIILGNKPAQKFAATEIFKLAPAYNDTKYTKLGKKVAIIGMKSAGKIWVVQRTNYQPALESSFRKDLNSSMQQLINNSSRESFKGVLGLLVNPAMMKSFVGYKENTEN